MQSDDIVQSSYMKEASVLSDWQPAADAAVKKLAATGKPFTADDIRSMVGDLEPHHPNAYGGLLSAWRTAGVIRPMGYASSRRSGRHRSVIRVWIGA